MNLKEKIKNHLLSGKALSSQYVMNVWKGQASTLSKYVYLLRKQGIPIDFDSGRPKRYRVNDSYFQKLAKHA